MEWLSDIYYGLVTWVLVIGFYYGIYCTIKRLFKK